LRDWLPQHGQHWIADIGIEQENLHDRIDAYPRVSVGRWSHQSRVQLDIAALPPKFRMRSNVSSVSIWRNVNREKICGAARQRYRIARVLAGKVVAAGLFAQDSLQSG
jgi:hypothetical protein